MLFRSLAAQKLELKLAWRGKGAEEHAVDDKGRKVVAVDRRYFRPAEVDLLIGDPALAEKELGWVPKTSFEELVQMMVDADMDLVKEAVEGGYAPPIPPE